MSTVDNSKHTIIDNDGEDEEAARLDTHDEFLRHYARRSGLTLERMAELGFVAITCDCGMEGCRGWRMQTWPDPEMIVRGVLAEKLSEALGRFLDGDESVPSVKVAAENTITEVLEVLRPWSKEFIAILGQRDVALAELAAVKRSLHWRRRHIEELERDLTARTAERDGARAALVAASASSKGEGAHAD